MLERAKLLKQYDHHRDIAERGLSGWRNEALKNMAFYFGDDMYDYPNRRKRKKLINFHLIPAYVNAIVGIAIQNRRKPDYIAKVMDDAQQRAFSNFLDSYSSYYRDRMNADQQETKQDIDLFVAGVGATDTSMVFDDYDADTDPNGDLIMERISPMDVFYDPNARMPSLTDGRFVLRRKTMPIEDAMEKYGADQEAFEYNPVDADSTYTYNPLGGVYNKESLSLDPVDENQVRVDHYQWWQYEPYYRAENPLLYSGDPEMAQMLQAGMEIIKRKMMEKDGYRATKDLFTFNPAAEYIVLTPKENKAMKGLCDGLGVPFTSVKRRKKCFYGAIISGSTLFKQYKLIDQSGFTIRFKTGFFAETTKMWLGLVHYMRDAQLYRNKAVTQLMKIISNNAAGGWLIEKGVTNDKQRFEQEINQTDTVVEVEAGALSGDQLRPKKQPFTPTGYDTLIGLSSSALNEAIGVDAMIFGRMESLNETASLRYQRVKQVMSVLAPYFDSIGLYQKLHARMMISLIRALAEISTDRLIPFKKDGSFEYIALSLDNMADAYDVVIEESPDSMTMKEERTNALSQLSGTLAQMGINIYDLTTPYILDNYGIKDADIYAIVERLKPQQPAPEMVQAEQEAAQLLKADQMSRIDKTRAEAEKTRADTAKSLVDAERIKEEATKVALETELAASAAIGGVQVNL